MNGTFTQANINSGNLTYTHDGGETTSDSFTFTVSDGAGGSLSATTFNITVTPVNDAPTVANPIVTQSATEDTAFSFTFPANTFADVDAGESLTYNATRADNSALPAWLTFNPATRTKSRKHTGKSGCRQSQY